MPLQISVRQVFSSAPQCMVRLPSQEPSLMPNQIKYRIKQLIIFDRFEFELDHLPAHHEAQVMLPEFPEPWKRIHQQLEAKPSPEC
jgi:hypothetical protein